MVENPLVPVVVVPDRIVDVWYLGSIEHLGLLVVEVLFQLRPPTAHQYYRLASTVRDLVLVMQMLGVALSLLRGLALLLLQRNLLDLPHQTVYIVIELDMDLGTFASFSRGWPMSLRVCSIFSESLSSCVN